VHQVGFSLQDYIEMHGQQNKIHGVTCQEVMFVLSAMRTSLNHI